MEQIEEIITVELELKNQSVRLRCVYLVLGVVFGIEVVYNLNELCQSYQSILGNLLFFSMKVQAKGLYFHKSTVFVNI